MPIMRPKSISSASLHLFFLLFFLCVIPFTRCDPSATTQMFKAPPSTVQYFEDSSTVLIPVLESGTVWRSTDGGVKWHMLAEEDGVTPGEILAVMLSPASNKIAVALGTRDKHWVTKDQGESWKAFEIEGEPDLGAGPISFHATEEKKIIMNIRKSRSSRLAYYTTDLFEEKPKVLAQNSRQCMWAKEKVQFDTGHGKSNDNRVLCIVEGRYSDRVELNRLLISDDYDFDKAEEPDLEDGRTVKGVVSMVAAKSYIMAARKSEGSDELAVYTTTDTNHWKRGLFGHQKILADAYTVMESRNYSIQVDVATGTRDNSMGMLYASNSNGTDFTRIEGYTNRNRFGIVDFENVQSVQGIVLVNIVDNHDDVIHKDAKKEVVSKISFNDGRDFEDLHFKDEKLHLHNMADARNVGRVFSSPAPGILMGIGNTGDFLRDYNDGDLYVSADAGVTWRQALKGAHKYEFGDAGALLVAIFDEKPTTKAMYSTDFGQHWREWVFAKDKPFVPHLLTTIPDSTSRKFVMLAKYGHGDTAEHLAYTLNFEDLDMKKCEKDDFEKWQPKDKDGKARCVMGHKQTFRRRKQDAKCYVGDNFHEPFPDNTEACGCTRIDFECTYGFYKEDGKCQPSMTITPPDGACKESGDTFEGPSPFRLIPGNNCDKELGEALDKKKVEYECGGKATSPPVDGKPSSTTSKFGARAFKRALYLESGEADIEADEEVIIILTDEHSVFITRDHGKNWKQVLKEEQIDDIYKNPYVNSRVYFTTSGRKVFYSQNRGDDIHEFRAPSPPNNYKLPVLRFHEKNSDWLIWTGCENEDSSKSCLTTAYSSTKNGAEWTLLRKAVENCEFVFRADRERKEELIFCEVHLDESTSKDSPKQLISSNDWFNHHDVNFDDMTRFATMSEFIVVAAKDKEDKDFLRLDASINARDFAHAKFPANFKVPHKTSYTVLDSSTHSIFLHVTVNEETDREYGSIVKSNSNGTYFTKSIENVNRNYEGYVDFDKMLGLEGVAIVNIIANKDEVDEGSMKKKQTLITHSDGAMWGYIKPPRADAEGKEYECEWNEDHPEECALHLHGYTERDDPGDTYSSPSAVGLMIGVGNVGNYLESKSKANTFISTDGGINWKTAMNGVYMWEYGDQGSLIVLVERADTNGVFFSIDEGKTWREFLFSDDKINVQDITTVPSDNSRNFMLWGKSGSSIVTVNLDFSSLTDKKCKLDKENPGSKESDYYLWEPEHPDHADGCLFGHKNQYRRKKTDRNCYNGRIRIDSFYDTVMHNCTCSRADFECNFNYEKAKDGSCQKVSGYEPTDPEEYWCSKPEAFEWWENTGYRKLEISTCEGGKELEKVRSHPCKGKGAQYADAHRSSKAAIFFAIIIPVSVALAAGYWVWRRWSQGKLGQIRLGDGPVGSAISRNAPSGQSMLVQIPVAIVSGFAAAVMAVPMVIGSLWRWGRDRFGGRGGRYGHLNVGGARGSNFRGTGRTYRSRSSFARGRGDYAAVGNEDESDLLGEDSEDEV